MAVRVTLSGAPLVVKKRKVINVRMGGEFSGNTNERFIGKKDILTVDMEKQGVSDVRYLIKALTIKESAQQIKIENFPSRFAVDNREGKPLHSVIRRTEVIFGNELDQAMIKFVERSVASAVKTLAPLSEHKGLGSPSGWQWMYVSNPKSDKVAIPVNPKNLKAMPVGSYLIYKPRSNLVGVANMLAARADANWPEEKWFGPGRSGGKGFMAQSVGKMKRSNLLKTYTMHTVFTSRFAVPGEKYRETSSMGAMTPVLVIRAKRNRRYKRIK